jgi:hypothetical protein
MKKGDPIYEAFVLYPAWGTLVEYVSRSAPREACPQSIYGSLAAGDRDRLAALLYAHHNVDSLDEADMVLEDLMVMAREGRRPRYAREMGFAPPEVSS